jgi:DNA-binding Lrp family transcriptional regulator
MELDATDLAILRAVRADASQSAAAIGRRVGVSQPVAWRRLRALRDAGVLKEKRFRLDREKLGFGVSVFLGIKMARNAQGQVADFERAVAAIPEVQSVEHVLGLYDYRLRVVARDLTDFERILRRRIMTLPGAGGVEANVLLSEERRPGPL